MQVAWDVGFISLPGDLGLLLARRGGYGGNDNIPGELEDFPESVVINAEGLAVAPHAVNDASTVDEGGESKGAGHGSTELGNGTGCGLVCHACADSGEDLGGKGNQGGEDLVDAASVEICVEKAKGRGMGNGQGNDRETSSPLLRVDCAGCGADLRKVGALGRKDERVGREQMALGCLCRMRIEHAEQVRGDGL